MSSTAIPSVLLVGGSGAVGRRAALALRQLHPDLPITIGGRDLAKASRLADTLGRADAVRIDLDRADLGLPAAARHSAIAVLMKDPTLGTLAHAQRHGIAYLAFSDFVFDIAPLVARVIHAPQAAPVLLLGHTMGGTAALAALYLVQGLRRVDSLEIAAVLDEHDAGGPAAQADIAELAQGAPLPLVLQDGSFRWLPAATAGRRFTGADGRVHQGQAYPLMDVASLAAETDARSIRVDLALRQRPAERVAELSNEVIIEVAGEQADGSAVRRRLELVHDDTYSALSAFGVAIALERLLGLVGGPPVAGGLHQPERLLDPSHVMARLQAFGVRCTAASTS